MSMRLDYDKESLLDLLLLAFLITIIIFILYHLISILIDYIKGRRYLNIIQKKRQERDSVLAATILPEIQISQNLKEEILNSDVTTLTRMLASRKVTSEQLVIIFAQRSKTIGLEYELIGETNFEEALQLAREYDKQLQKPGLLIESRGLLYGIPISIKENYEMRGFDCTYGCGALCNRPYHSDGYIVRLLRSEGAIPFVRSNIPQFSFAMECYNELYGRGLNPWNKSRTPGGSSGGEAGLIAARCSPIGLGSDMGGSIRGPAGFCGIVGFKPSGKRVSAKGHSIMSEAFNGIAQIIKNCPGPLCKSVDDVNLMMKCFLNEKFFKENRDKEPDIHHFFVPWNEELIKSKQKMKIGYIKNDEFMPVTPTFIRAIEEACEILKKNGHELVEINIPFLNEIQGMYYQILSMEGDLLLFQDVSKEQRWVSTYKLLSIIGSFPNFLKTLVKKIFLALKWPRMAGNIENFYKLSTHEALILLHKLQILKEKFFKLWGIHNLDILLVPTIGVPAYKHDFSNDLNPFAVYTFLGSLFDIPAGNVPITLIGENETIYDEKRITNRDSISKKAQENLLESPGMPVGIQVCGRYFEDEKCVNIMKQIEIGIGFSKNHGFPI